MITILKKEVSANLPASAAEAVSSDLKNDFTPLINSVKKEYWTTLGLPFPEEASPLISEESDTGEIYLSKTGNLFYYTISDRRKRLECGGLLKNDGAQEFNQFSERIGSSLQRELKVKDIKWKTLTRDETFQNLSSYGIPLSPTKEELATAHELENPDLLHVLMNTQNLLSYSARNLANLLEDKMKADTILEKLVQTKLMTKDFVVLCKEKGQQIIKVASRQAIEETSQKGLKCFLCGKPISEENIEELLCNTELGRKMIDKGYWMPVRVLETLGRLGIKNQEVVKEAEEDFFTLYFLSSGEIVMAATLPRKFSLSDAYTLNAKLSVSQAGVGIVVSTHPVSIIYKEFLIQSNPERSLYFLEIFSNLEERLEQIIKTQQQETIRRVTESFTKFTSVTLSDLVCQKLFGIDEAKKTMPVSSPQKKGRGKQETEE
jgi:hypothetical protein